MQDAPVELHAHPRELGRAGASPRAPPRARLRACPLRAAQKKPTEWLGALLTPSSGVPGADAVRSGEQRPVAADGDDEIAPPLDAEARAGARSRWPRRRARPARRRTSSTVSAWSSWPGRMRRTVSSPASSRRAMRASFSSSTHLRHDERLSTTHDARRLTAWTSARRRRRELRLRVADGAAAAVLEGVARRGARRWRRRARGPSRPRSGRTRAARVDLDAIEDVTLADDPGRGEGPLAERAHRLAAHARSRAPRSSSRAAAAAGSSPGSTRPAGSSQRQPSCAGGTGRSAQGGRTAERRKTCRTPVVRRSTPR